MWSGGGLTPFGAHMSRRNGRAPSTSGKAQNVSGPWLAWHLSSASPIYPKPCDCDFSLPHSGKPGTGKTGTLSQLLRAYAAEKDQTPTVCVNCMSVAEPKQIFVVRSFASCAALAPRAPLCALIAHSFFLPSLLGPGSAF
jgi:hypothetical protein